MLKLDFTLNGRLQASGSTAKRHSLTGTKFWLMDEDNTSFKTRVSCMLSVKINQVFIQALLLTNTAKYVCTHHKCNINKLETKTNRYFL
jgi:hypothetical protein